LNAQLFYTDLEFDDFEQKSLGGELVMSHLLDEEGRTRLFLRYAYAEREVTPDNDVNAASILQREILHGNESTSLIGMSVRQDLRNDRIAPTAGRILEGSVDYAGLGGFSNFLRFEGRGVWYKRNPEWFPGWFPFKERGVWSFGARAGWAIPFNTIGDYDFEGVQIPGLVPTADGERNCAASRRAPSARGARSSIRRTLGSSSGRRRTASHRWGASSRSCRTARTSWPAATSPRPGSIPRAT
jgi:outer membrane protein assembly factor BamA